LYIEGGNGHDSIDVSLFVTDMTMISGGEGNDTIHGGFGHDSIDGGAGNDTIYGRTGNDLINGGAGNDSIYGEDGNDILRGGDNNDLLVGDAGNDILLGEGGNDSLDGGHGGDLLIGGLGADSLVGDQGEDILIGGYTTFDSNNAALLSIVSEWNATRNFNTRVANIKGTGSGSRLNGNNFLKANITVVGDSAIDTLEGDAGKDWFFASLTDDLEDKKITKFSIG